MPKCVYKKKKILKICSGELTTPISIQTRSIVAPDNTNNDTDYDELFTSFSSFWSLVETVRGETIFDGSNIERVVTHRFYIHYVPELTFEKWIEYNGRRFMIVDVENIGEQNSYFLIRANVRGDASLPVNSQ